MLALVERLLEAGEPLIKAKRVRKPSWDGLLAVRGVVQSEDAASSSEDARAALEAVLAARASNSALDELSQARQAEGPHAGRRASPRPPIAWTR